MKKLFGLIVLILSAANVLAQKEIFDIISFKPLKGWTKETKVNSMVFSKIDGGSWCQIILYKNTITKGNINADFDSEWESLIIPNCKGISSPTKENSETGEDWTVMSGSGVWKFNGNNVATILTTYSGNGACVSIVCNATAKPYLDIFINFVASVDLYNGKKEDTFVTGQNQNNKYPNASPAVNGNYKFTSTNFDDGWTSVVKEDWVEVTKGDIKVLLHYPKAGTVFPADPEPLTNAAWNILVAPRYSNLKNYKTTYISGYERSTFGFGNATENASGKEVFVLLLRKGSSPWIEFIAPDKASFTQNFKFDPYTIQWNSEGSVLNPLTNMVAYNKFAISMSDFTGKWADKFSSNTYYANVYTGESAGMSTYTSSQSFEFSGDTYKWNLVAINSYGGQAKFGQGKGNGTFKVLNNWQIYFSEMEGKPKTFDAYFSATKGGRVLWMNDAQYPGSGIFTGFVPL